MAKQSREWDTRDRLLSAYDTMRQRGGGDRDASLAGRYDFDTLRLGPGGNYIVPSTGPLAGQKVAFDDTEDPGDALDMAIDPEADERNAALLANADRINSFEQDDSGSWVTPSGGDWAGERVYVDEGVPFAEALRSALDDGDEGNATEDAPSAAPAAEFEPDTGADDWSRVVQARSGELAAYGTDDGGRWFTPKEGQWRTGKVRIPEGAGVNAAIDLAVDPEGFARAGRSLYPSAAMRGGATSPERQKDIPDWDEYTELPRRARQQKF